MTAEGLKRLYLGYIVAAALVGGITSGSFVAGLVEPELAIKLFLAFFCFTFVVGLPLMWVWWRKVDEAVREAHKWAWFWGGSIGIMLGIFLAAANVFMNGQLVATLLVSSGFGAYPFEAGLIAMTMLVAYGYMAAWALWWWKHR